MNKTLVLAAAAALTLASAQAFAFADDNQNSNTGSNIANDGATVDNSTNDSSDNSDHSRNLTVGDVSVDLTEVDVDVKKNENEATFESNSNVTASVLGATIASSNVDFKPEEHDDYAGNDIHSYAFNSATGLIAVNQNTGINANNQQAVTVSVGNVGAAQ